MLTPMVFDFETLTITEERTIPKPICVSYADEQGTGIYIGKDMEKFLEKIMHNKSLRLIAHNAKFEMMCIAQHYPQLEKLVWEAYEEDRVYCTLIEERIIDNFRRLNLKNKKIPYSLSALVKEHLKIDISASKKDPDAWRLRYGELEGIPLKDWPQAAIDYSLLDSVYTKSIFEIQQKIEYKRVSHSVRADFILGYAGLRGLEVDPERVKVLEQEVEQKLKEPTEYLISNGFARMDKKGFHKEIKVLQEYFLTYSKEVRETKKRSTSLKMDYLKEYSPNEYAPFSFLKVKQSLIDMDAYVTLKTKFLKDLKGATKLRSNYNPVVTTGRTSCFKTPLYPSINLQQMPQGYKDLTYDVRGCFKATEGYKLVSLDYGGLELCVGGHMANVLYGKSAMADYLNYGSTPADVHSRFAVEIYNDEHEKPITYEYFLANKKQGICKKYRKIAKTPNLSFLGGIGNEKMGAQMRSRGVDIQYTELLNEEGKRILCHSEHNQMLIVSQLRKKYPNIRSQQIGKYTWMFVDDPVVRLRSLWLKLYPEFHKFLTSTHTKFLTGETAWVEEPWRDPKTGKPTFKEEPLYRFEYAGIKRDKCIYPQFCNALLMQSVSAQGAKIMLWELGKETFQNPEINLNAFIHDEVLVEIKDNENLEANMAKVANIMIDGMQSLLSTVRIQVEASTMDYWSKETPEGEIERLYWKNVGDKELKC